MSKGWCENQEFVDTLHFCAFKKVISSKQLKLSARFEGKNTWDNYCTNFLDDKTYVFRNS